MSESVYYLPVMLNCQGQHCLVVGGGKVAERKTTNLLQAGAVVTLISPVLTDTLAALAAEKQLYWLDRYYQGGDVSRPGQGRRYFLVHAATSDSRMNAQIAEEAYLLGIPVNIADRSEGSTFINPTVIRRGRLVASVSTSGAGPAAGRQIAQELDQQFGNEYEVYIEFLYTLRHHIKAKVTDASQRRSLLERASALNILEDIRQNRFEWWDDTQIERWIRENRGR